VKAYLDSGAFIDYLSGRGPIGSYLRTSHRRGRTPQQLVADAEACLSSILARHTGITSSLTCYEVEEAMYRELGRSMSGVLHADSYIIPSARAAVTQVLVTVEQFKISLIDLTQTIVHAQCGNIELQKRGIRAADALHVTTALAEGADLLVSTDSAILALDRIFRNVNSGTLRCLDTDRAAPLLA